jgi:hypothetical protein
MPAFTRRLEQLACQIGGDQGTASLRPLFRRHTAVRGSATPTSSLETLARLRLTPGIAAMPAAPALTPVRRVHEDDGRA